MWSAWRPPEGDMQLINRLLRRQRTRCSGHDVTLREFEALCLLIVVTLRGQDLDPSSGGRSYAIIFHVAACTEPAREVMDRRLQMEADTPAGAPVHPQSSETSSPSSHQSFVRADVASHGAST